MSMINGTRLYDHLTRLGRIGFVPKEGTTRLPYTPAYDEGRIYVQQCMEQAGLQTSVDPVGNLIGTLPGQGEIICIGSHIDTVPGGGIYDGTYGVLSGIECVQRLKELGYQNRHPIQVIAFTEEEGNVIGGTFGSKAFTGGEIDEAMRPNLALHGLTMEQVGACRRDLTQYQCYLELHIEQGKVLEECKTQVGIVGTIAGPVRYRVYLRGMAEHSGATPMDMRSDALCAAAEIILEMEKIGKWESAYESVATVGVVQNHPNVLNVIPGRVELGVDMRGIDQDSLDRMERAFKAAVRESCKKRGVEYVAEKINSIPPISMSESVEDGLEQAAKRLGISSRRMPSGAGHDAMSFAEICDSGMVFIPCRGGVSHNPSEHAEITSICDGARVMYEYLKGETAK